MRQKSYPPRTMRRLLAGPQGLELAGGAEAPQIGRYDRLHRGGLDAQSLQRAPLAPRAVRDDIVDAQELDLVGRERRRGEELEEERLEPGEPERDRDQQPPALDGLEGERHDVAQRKNLRPADLVDRARAGLARH